MSSTTPPPDLVLDGASLALTPLVRAARAGSPVGADPAALAAATTAHHRARAAAAGRPVYGATTGVGANRDVPLDPAATDSGLALWRSHAVSAGPPRSRERVRATLVVRANQLLAGGSGASPALVTGLLDLLAADDLPPVRELGGVGTGDLTALATVGLALARRGTPVAATDALPLLSSNAATLADAALAVCDLTALAGDALAVAAATFTAVDGNAEAFAPGVERASPFAGARHVARTMRSLVTADPPARIQDPFALRTLPQVHGAWFDALARAATVTTRMVNAPAENPLFETGAGIAHHGAFHAAELALALDSARAATLGALRLSAARLALLCEPAMTTLPPFLGDPARPGASGVLGLEYVAGAALGDLQLLAGPAALVTASLSRGLEEHASFASLAARAALGMVAAGRTVVAAELLAALRALAMRGRPVPAAWTALAAGLGGSLDEGVAERDLTADLDRATAALAPGGTPGVGQ